MVSIVTARLKKVTLQLLHVNRFKSNNSYECQVSLTAESMISHLLVNWSPFTPKKTTENLFYRSHLRTLVSPVEYIRAPGHHGNTASPALGAIMRKLTAIRETQTVWHAKCRTEHIRWKWMILDSCHAVAIQANISHFALAPAWHVCDHVQIWGMKTEV